MGRVLPMDIIIEILLRLPVTSLLRFRRVSKSWKTLITSPKFAYHHIHLQNSLVSTSNRFVIIKRPNSRHLFRVNFDTPLSNAVKLALPKGFFKSSYDRIVLGGSCNGLICLYSFVTGKIILLNPINYTYFKATISGQPFKARSVAFGFDSIGFGFDSINNDYKVVCTSYYNAIVYSFKKKSWRYIDPNNGGYIFYINEMVVGALVNNHLLHWIVSLHRFPEKMIACFDLCMEQWSLINLPIDFQMQHRHKLSVHENGCLCLSIVHCQDLVDVWILKDYAVEESWVKIRVSINYPLFVKYHRFCYNKQLFPCLYALLKSEKWYAEICTGSLVTLRHGRKFSWKHHLSKAFSCLTT